MKKVPKIYDFRHSLAPARGFEPPTYRLGGGRSILLSYAGMYEIVVLLSIWSVHLAARGGRSSVFLGGSCSILLSYVGV